MAIYAKVEHTCDACFATKNVYQEFDEGDSMEVRMVEGWEFSDDMLLCKDCIDALRAAKKGSKRAKNSS